MLNLKSKCGQPYFELNFDETLLVRQLLEMVSAGGLIQA